MIVVTAVAMWAAGVLRLIDNVASDDDTEEEDEEADDDEKDEEISKESTLQPIANKVGDV